MVEEGGHDCCSAVGAEKRMGDADCGKVTVLGLEVEDGDSNPDPRWAFGNEQIELFIVSDR